MSMKHRYKSLEALQTKARFIKKSNTFYTLVCVILIFAGFLIGLSLEDSIPVYLRKTTIDFSDVIASIGLTITASFAYFGLKEQRQLKIMQAEPYLHVMIKLNREERAYELEVINSGAGAAVDMAYQLIWEESYLDNKYERIGIDQFRLFLKKATDNSDTFEMVYSTPSAFRSSDNYSFLELSLKEPDSEKFRHVENVLKRTTLQLRYKTVFGELREKSFPLLKNTRAHV